MTTQAQRDQASDWRRQREAAHRETIAQRRLASWRSGQSLIIEGQEFILSLPERGCACHPAMPVVRTPDGWACQGCGVPSA